MSGPPRAPYTSLTDDELRFLLARFGVHDVKCAERLQGGLANSSTLVTCPDQRLVLTVCDDKSAAEIATLTALLEALEAARFPATRLVRATAGALHVLHDGKAVILKSYIEGAPPAHVTGEVVRHLGAALGALHTLSYHGPLPESHAYGLEHFGEREGWPADHPFVPWLTERTRQLEQRLDWSLPRGLIHADAWPENTIFRGGQLVALIDFEEACRYYLIFDLAMCVVGFSLADGRLNPGLVGELLRGYQRARPLLAAERSQLSLWVVYAAATSAFWRFRQFNVRVPDPARADLYLEVAALAEQAEAGGLG
jgi:homoserine kinase type II